MRRVRDAEVREDRVEEGDDGDREDAAAGEGREPVDRGTRGPAVPEEAHGQGDAADEGRWEDHFGAEWGWWVVGHLREQDVV